MMEDNKIIELYFARSESAISETASKYGKYCYSIAYDILLSNEDSEECVNDTYLRAWNSIPPQRPSRLSLFLARITRNLALNRYEYNHAKKRNTVLESVFDEVSELLAYSPSSPAYSEKSSTELGRAINSFLALLSKRSRMIFVRRYWYLSSIKEIANDYGIPEGTVKSELSRLRKRFADHLLKEGIKL